MIEIQKIVSVLGWVSFAVMVFFIIYRKILKKLQHDRIQKELYIVLHPIEKEPASGVVPIYIESFNEIQVEVSIHSFSGAYSEVIADKKLKKGGNIIQLDTTKLPNGVYFYQAITENQRTKKAIEIRN